LMASAGRLGSSTRSLWSSKGVAEEEADGPFQWLL